MTDAELINALNNAKSTGQVIAPTKTQFTLPSNLNPKWIDALAQLETQGGKKVVGDNNLFNIKDNSGKGKTAYDKVEGSRDAYMSYDSPEASKQALVDLLKRKYPAAYNATSAEEFVAGLKGYATDVNHGKKLLSIINKPGISDNTLLSMLNNAKAPEVTKPTGNAPVVDNTPKYRTGFFGEQIPIEDNSGLETQYPTSAGKTFAKSALYSLTAGSYKDMKPTEEEKKAHPLANMAGEVTGYTPYAIAAAPGGLAGEMAMSAFHSGMMANNEGGSNKDIAIATGAGAVGGAVGNVAGRVVKGGIDLARSAVAKTFPTITEKVAGKPLGEAIKEGEKLSEQGMRASMLPEGGKTDVGKAVGTAFDDATKKTLDGLRNGSTNILLGGAAGAYLGDKAGLDSTTGAISGAMLAWKGHAVKGLIQQLPNMSERAGKIITNLKPTSDINKTEYATLVTQKLNSELIRKATDQGRVLNTAEMNELKAAKNAAEAYYVEYQKALAKITNAVSTHAKIDTTSTINSATRNVMQNNKDYEKKQSQYKLTGQNP